ncbi:AIFM3 [Symbiodinium natans]|uniref:AIFM3 protein n=1 Tax=Symbiodinium natans TaxID=878477 RepID=A0A812NT47_9DINO|nr:AIFM3 [Symbiodinium natans]
MGAWGRSRLWMRCLFQRCQVAGIAHVPALARPALERWDVRPLAAVLTLALTAEQARRAQGKVGCASTQRISLGQVTEFEEASMREVKMEGGGAVLVHRHQGEFFVTSPACAHYGAPLRKGISSAGGRGGPPTVTCPLHDATFDLRTGQVVRGPSVDGIAVYKSEVKNGVLYADIPPELVAGTGKHPKVLKQMTKRTSADQRVFALLGGGPASLAAAETLRQEGFVGRIVMLTREPHLPYDRVQLSKALDKPVEKLLLRPEGFYKDYDIEVVRNACVTKLDTKTQTVHYTSGDAQKETVHFDKVLVATGGTPRKLFVPGSDLKNIFTLRTPEDAAKIAQLAKKGQKMIVVGGSFIGMEVASSLAKKGCDVAVIAMETVPFERVLGKKVGASFARKLQKEGVEWFGTSQVRLFRGNEAVNGVELEDGEVLPADAVVVGAGVLPNTRFIEGLSLDKNGAIIVNPLLQAEACENLFAAGDVCAYPAVRTGQRVRIEHWDVATQQGRVAAQNMLGKFQPFTTTPFFWSGLFGNLNLRFVGHAPEALDRVIIEGDVSNMEFISYYTEDDEIRAVATVNKDPVAVACAELMRRGQMPRVAELMLGTVNAEVLLQRLRDLSKAPAR